MFSTSCRQSKIQRLSIPCLARVWIQSSTIESGVTFMPTIAVGAGAGAQGRVGQRGADRVEALPRVLLAEADHHLEDRAAGEVDDAVAGAVDRVGDREDLAGAHPHPPVALLAVAQGLVDDLDPRHQAASSRRRRPARAGTPPRPSGCGPCRRRRRGARAGRARSRRSSSTPSTRRWRSAWRMRASAASRSAPRDDQLRQQRVVVGRRSSSRGSRRCRRARRCPAAAPSGERARATARSRARGTRR